MYVFSFSRNDPRYKDGPSEAEFPSCESLKLTIERTLPYWDEVIVPQLKAGKRILVAAHGNSLRGIVKHLDNMSDEAIMGCNLPTGIPFVYELDADLKVSFYLMYIFNIHFENSSSIFASKSIFLSLTKYIFQPVVSMQFLGDEETVKKAIESVANQGKAK